MMEVQSRNTGHIILDHIYKHYFASFHVLNFQIFK